MEKIPSQYRGMVKKALIAAAAAGLLGILPNGVLDAAALMGIWSVLIGSMAADAQLRLDKVGTAKIVTSVIIGIAGYYAGCEFAGKLFAAISLTGPVIAAGVSIVANVFFIYQSAWFFACMLEKEITRDSLKSVGAEMVEQMLTGGVSLAAAKDIVSIYCRKA